jgi:hypothetical protein
LSNMRQILTWLKTRLETFALLPDYGKATAKQWMNILFGETVLGVVFLIWWAIANPQSPPLVLIFVAAMLVAGYFVWRADHIRLLPQFAVRDFCRQSTPTTNGECIYVQLLPKCLTEANVTECRGILTSVERWNGSKQEWETIETESMFLQWSHGSEQKTPAPITLYSRAENRLNIFLIHSRDTRIRPCVIPFPNRFQGMFDRTPSASFSFRFNIHLIAKDCKAVDVSLTVQPTDNALNPFVKLEGYPLPVTAPRYWGWAIGFIVLAIAVSLSIGIYLHYQKPALVAVPLAPPSNSSPPDEGKVYPGPGDDVNLPPLGPDDSFKAPAPRRGPFAVYLGTATLRQRDNLAQGPYVQSVQGCPADTTVAIHYLTHMSITNRLPVKTFIKSYSVEVRTGRGEWEHLVHLQVIPPDYELYFFHFSERLTRLLDMPLIDDSLRDHALEPGESVSGFALFAFPKNHQPLAVSRFTTGSTGKGLVIGQFPLNDVRVSVVDSMDHSINNVFAGREWNPDSIQPATFHFKFGPPMPQPYRLTGYDLDCNR